MRLQSRGCSVAAAAIDPAAGARGGPREHLEPKPTCQPPSPLHQKQPAAEAMGAAAKAGGKAAKKAQQKAVKLETKKKVGRRAIAAHGAFGAGRVGVGLPSVSRHRRCAQVEENC